MENLGIEWILFISLFTLITMGYDKRQAKRRKRRVPEKNLWFLAFVGGGIGAYLGMQIFRHKTLHTNFRVGFLMLALLDIALLLFLAGFRVPAGVSLF